MFHERVACLQVKGCGLVLNNIEIANAIAVTASSMIVKNSKRQQVKTDFLECLMTTDNQIGFIGSLVGYVFRVVIETEANNAVTMDFLLTRPLSEEELEHVSWGMVSETAEQEKSIWN